MYAEIILYTTIIMTVDIQNNINSLPAAQALISPRAAHIPCTVK